MTQGCRLLPPPPALPARSNFLGGLIDSKSYGHKSNLGYKGYKGSIFEGGHRVPLIVRYDKYAQIKGCVINDLTSIADIYSSIQYWARIPATKAHLETSFSFAGRLASCGKVGPPPRESLFIFSKPFQEEAVRRGREMKLVGRSFGGRGSFELYNISVDMAEVNSTYCLLY